MNKCFVKIEETGRGYMPTFYFPTNDGFGDRTAFCMGFDDLEQAVSAARDWASSLNVEYREFKPFDPDASRLMVETVKKFREEGLDLREAIKKANETLKS